MSASSSRVGTPGLRLRQRISGHLRPRRLHLYGVGNGKSGTTSLTQMFDYYHAGHEVDPQRMRALAASVVNGEVDVDAAHVRAALRNRTRRFHLEVDVAGYMSVFAGTLAQMYPDAKFVLLIRDCFSWLNSRIEHLADDPPNQPGVFYVAQYMRYDDPFAAEESELAEVGLRPIASYLRAWADLTERVLVSVPADRLLVVRTEDLGASAQVLARFADVSVATVQPVHTNRNPSPTGFLSHVPLPFVIEQARAQCGPLMERFWGADWSELSTRLPHHITT